MERIGRYQIVREIGRGGMGAVYEARDPELERGVAIKVLYSEHASLVRDEARALAALNYPGIVTIHEIGEHEGRPYLVMELLRGRSLRELLQHAQVTERDRRIEICARVAAAIAEAHDHGVLHRDIKPENVVVLDNGGVKVVDFGIARRLDDTAALAPSADDVGMSRASRIVSAFAGTLPVDITPSMAALQPTIPGAGAATVASLASSTQTVFGTPAYMAPEVLSGGASSAASDVYSLGILLYECLAGRRPYDAPRLVDVVDMVLDPEVVPPVLADPLAPLIARMMARDRALRPPVREVAAALARRPRRRRSKRWRFGVLAGSLVLCSLVGVAGWRLLSLPSQSAAIAHHAPGPIAMEAFGATYKTYGDQPAGLASVLSIVLAHVDGLRIVEPAQLELDRKSAGDHAAAARQLGARYLLRGNFIESEGQATGDLELVDLVAGTSQHIVARAPVAHNATLIVELANEVAARVLPGSRLEPADQVALARKLYEIGIAELNAQHWGGARQFLEQVVEADPTSSRAWDALASARGWTLAPQPLIEEAITRALAGAPPDRRTILEGAGAYFRHDFDTAVTTLEPLTHASGLSTDDQIDLAYYLGESLWHRGDHARGAELLQRVFDARRNFEPAGVHLMQYAIVHRDLPRAGVLIGQLGRSRQTYLFAAGEYEAVARSGEFPLDFQAQLVLGRPVASTDEAKLGTSFDGYAYRTARALVAGDRVAARAELGAAWTKVLEEPVTDRLAYDLGNLADVIASSGLHDETATLLAFLHAGSSPRYASMYRRLACLAAPLIGTVPPVLDTSATPRQRQLAAAIASELAGDHGAAARSLAELVADPSDTWELGERIALIRNLRAHGDTAQIVAQCKEVVRPPVFRYDFLLARQACDKR